MAKEFIKLQVDPCNISFVNWIIEGYEHLGVVSTLDRQQGIIIITSTSDMMPDLLEVVRNFTFPVRFLEETIEKTSCL